ncbi:hemolysin family protein [Thauera aromatica]|uniref:Polyamine export protein n=1 Tax=Thauera aromatica K172 TaxID=44139 RepID=A0A2R4BQR3_THAAR|nr:hemolysin family protein [Thauera aromatica]AVR89679.1 membrane protein [Thauera aromatica K172]MCK2097421.1 hemolysin family protein [Thauera aromatica]
MLLDNLLIILALIAASAFFSMSEISLAASRKIKLRLMAEGGHVNAQRVLALQDSPGNFFTVVQIGLNAVAILGGIVGEQALSPYVAALLRPVYDGPVLGTASFVLSFSFVTALFVLFADLMPKRLAMVQPERVAVGLVRPMQACMWLLAPLVWVFNGLADRIFRLLRIPSVRTEDITPADIVAMADAGAQAGALLRQEQHLISNVFELDSRIVPSAMTSRESIVFLTLSESEESIRRKIAEHPHGKFPVCEDGIDSVIGYVDAKDILPRIVHGKNLSLRTQPIVRKVLMLPDTLSLFEALERFRDAKEDFALVINEYALVVGLLSLQDVMSTVMGDLVSPFQEELIVRRDDHSWLIDGVTPIEDVMQALDIEVFEGFQNYETVAGFLMYRLRKVPKRTDFVVYAGYKFEVVDIDSYRIDQVLVTRENPPAAPAACAG